MLAIVLGPRPAPSPAVVLDQYLRHSLMLLERLFERQCGQAANRAANETH